MKTVSASKILMTESKSVAVESMEEKESPTKPPRNDGRSQQNCYETYLIYLISSDMRLVCKAMIK